MNMKLLALVALPLLARAEAAPDPVAYLDWDETTRAFVTKECSSYTVVTAEMSELSNGWFVVKGDVSRGRTVVSGKVNLILADGADYGLSGLARNEGALIVSTGNELTIYGQTQGTGRLHVAGNDFAAGIGGDGNSSCGKVTIVGGIVNAYASMWAAAIGGGQYGSAGAITILGGTVTATHGTNGVGIGAGADGEGGKVVISGGCVNSDGIGCGLRGTPAAVSITGGVFSKKVDESWLAKGYYVCANEDDATKSAYPYAIARGVTVTIGELKGMTAVWTCGDQTVTNVVDATTLTVPQRTSVSVMFTPISGWELTGSALYTFETEEDDLDIRGEITSARVSPVEYVDENGELKTNTTCTVISAATTMLGNGWYVVAENIARERITVTGAANLILTDGVTLSVSGNIEEAGMAVGSGRALAIYGQRAGTGKLEAVSGAWAAGIGGNKDSACGTVTIVGGRVTATYGTNGVGIGAGASGNGGQVVISGGCVDTDGIGCGRDGMPAAVSITGGVFAQAIEESWVAEGYVVLANTDEETKDAYPYAVYPAGGVTVTIGELERMTAAWTSGDGSVTNAIEGTSFEVERGKENVKVIFTADEDFELVGEATYEIGMIATDLDISAHVPTVTLKPVTYLAWDAKNKVLTNAVCMVCELVTKDTATFENGKWYVVKDIVSRDTIRVNGTANLILADGAKLSVTASDTQAAGLNVSRGNALTIYAQEAGTGALDAIGGSWAAGIGGGRGESAGNVTIRGGAVTARAGEKILESTIGRGYGNSTSDGRTVISGGIFGMTIRSTWLESGFGVIENPDAETATAYPWKIVGACKVTIGNHTNVNVKWTSGDGSVTNDVSGTSFAIDTGLTNVKMIFAPAEGFVLVGENEYELGTVTTDLDITVHVPTAVLEPVSYLAWDAEERTTTNAVCTVCEPVTAETTTLEDGKWYAVRGQVSRGMIAVNGSAHLILCDGAKLSVQGGGFEPGISVAGSHALTIYGQDGDSGELSATGGNLGAGIGCGFRSSSGSVTIHGGRVKAKGVDASDIGPGSESMAEGTIAITGGLFGMSVEQDWLAELCEVIGNTDEQSKGAYPYLVRPIPMVTVTVGELQNMSAQWTSGDGAVTNALERASFEVLRDTENVTILFTPAEGYEFFTSDKAELGTVTEDITLQPSQIPVAYRKGDFSARFVQTGNGVGRIEVADHGLSRTIDIVFPVTSGEVSRTYTSELSGQSTNLTFGVIFVDDNDSVVLPKDLASNPSYLNKDNKVKAFPGRYLPKDIKVKGDTITLYNYGQEFDVKGIDIVTESNKEDKKNDLVGAIIDFLKNSDHSGGGKSWTFFISVFGTEDLAISFITEYVDVFVEEFVDEINDAVSTIKKLRKMLEMLESIITRLSATVYIGEGEKDGDYYTAAKAPDAFNKVAGSSTAVHFMRNARTPAYTATKKLTIDMHGAPKVDATALSDLIDGIDFGEGTPDFVEKLIKKMVEEAIDLRGNILQSATAVDHVSAQSNNGVWLTVADGAAVTISNFNLEGGSVGNDLSTSLIVVSSGSLTLNKVTMNNYNVGDKSAAIRVSDGATLTLIGTCMVTGSSSGNVFVASTATLSTQEGSSRVGISGQTEDGDAFAVKASDSYASVYTNDSHPRDAGYTIVEKEGRLYWLYTPQRDPADPDFPTPGEESEGVALNVRIITLSDGTQVARLWGAPVNGEKGAWYYLEATTDLKGEFAYLEGYKWKASKDGPVAEMQKGADRSCCDVPTEDMTKRFFRFRSLREEPKSE